MLVSRPFVMILLKSLLADLVYQRVETWVVLFPSVEVLLEMSKKGVDPSIIGFFLFVEQRRRKE